MKHGTSASSAPLPPVHPLVELWQERMPLFAGIFLFGIVLWTFLPAIDGEFIGYDDPDYVSANPQVQQGLSWAGLKWAFASAEAANWHPLTWVSHMLDCQLFGLAPWGHHLSSLLLHALNTLLVFMVFRRITGGAGRSFVLALFFGLHPLRVESVAWIAERKDVLSTTFWLLTLWAYGRYAQADGGNGEGTTRKAEGKMRGASCELRAQAFRFYLLAFGVFCLGLMSKPMLVTVPCVLLLLDYWPLRRWSQRSGRLLLVEKIPFFAVALASAMVTFLVQRRGGAMLAGLPLADRVANAIVSYGRYLGKVFYPVDLAAFYPPMEHWPGTEVALAGVLVLALCAAAFALRHRAPYCLVGWFWFLGTLVPVIGLVPAGEQSMADRYSYVPSLGIVLAVVWGVHDLTKRWRFQVPVMSMGIGGVTLLCVVLTRAQVSYWKDTERLFRHALLVTRGNYLAHNNVGTALDKQGKWEDALGEFRAALRAKPDYPEALNNFGVALTRQGQLDEAIKQFLAALNQRPRYAAARFNLGAALQDQGRLDEAILQYQQALRLQPRYTDAHYNLGLALQRKGDLEGAITQFEAVRQLEPGSPEVCNNLGVALEHQGRLDDAISQYLAALRLKPDYARAHFNLGVALSRKGQLDQAAAEFEQTLKLDPTYAAAQTNLAAMRELKASLEKR